MPRYVYKARDKEGQARTGAIEAEKKEIVADRLSGMGLIPVFIQEEAGSGLRRFDALKNWKRVPARDLIIFNRQVATLLSAGFPFTQILTTMEKQTENVRLKEVIGEIRRDLEGGTTFSEAIAKHPSIFSNLSVSMIRAGEAAGILDEMLNRLALLAEHEVETRERVKTATRYPLIVVTAICLAFIFLVTFVIPKFSAIFARFKTELPLSTRLLIGINQVFHNYWHVAVIILVLLVSAVAWHIRTPRGRRHWDGLKLRLPLFGGLFQKVALSRFARVFSEMQKSGLPMMATLDVAGEVTGNVVIAGVVEEMRKSLSEGKGLLAPMEASGLFPPLIVQMISVGEETGQIDTMLSKVSDYYDTDVEYTLRNLSSMLEPVLLFFVGGMVLLLALGIFQPMWNMLTLFRK